MNISPISRAILNNGFSESWLDHIGDNEQLIFTTHNTDMLDLNLPKHSYVFLRKKAGGWKVSSFRYFSVGGAEKEYRLIEKCGGK